MKNLSIISHEISLHQDTPKGHPECAERYEAIKTRIDGNYKNWSRIQAPLATREQLLRAHTKTFLDYIDEKASAALNPVGLDADTWAGKLGVEAALRGAGGACLAVDKVMETEEGASFSAMQPPGHHAEPDKAMGFCVYSSAAVAAKHAQQQWGLERVAVLDFDVHHGNGTQEIFYNDETVLYASSHEFPLFPGTGSEQETGVGNIFNAPLKTGMKGKEFLKTLDQKILRPIDKFKPEIILISAGFDAHVRDPLANINLESEDFYQITKQIVDLANIHSKGRVISFLEGGYDLLALSESIKQHLLALKN